MILVCLVGQKFLKFLVGSLEEMMTSSIHSEFNWPLAMNSRSITTSILLSYCCSLMLFSTVDLSPVVPVKSTVEILQNFVSFSEYTNFTKSQPAASNLQNSFQLTFSDLSNPENFKLQENCFSCNYIHFLNWHHSVQSSEVGT